jgi:hypothetical protein
MKPSSSTPSVRSKRFFDQVGRKRSRMVTQAESMALARGLPPRSTHREPFSSSCR